MAASTKQVVWASTVITGSITVSPYGSVRSYALDHPQELSRGIVDVLARNVPEWKFKPYTVDGKAVAATATMGVRLVARKLDHGNYAIRVGGAWFGKGADTSAKPLGRRVPPRYPEEALQNRVSGSVYLVAKISREGRVLDVAAQQVDLRLLAPEAMMRRWRKCLADAARKAVRQWDFPPSAAGTMASAPYRVVRVPIHFELDFQGQGSAHRGYGEWESYVPGPINLVPWLSPRQLAGGSPDAMPAGAIEQLGTEPLQLQTSLSGS